MVDDTRSSLTEGLFAGGGAVGAQMRAHDWSCSPLGDPETWSQSLRSVVGLLLGSKFPMFVAWGPDLGLLYNDAYAEILGAKHPTALGTRFQDVWSEIWPDILPLIDAALAGEAIYREDLPLVMNRKGYDEQTWFTFSYSPVRDDDGLVAGMFCAVAESTRQVLADLRQTFRLGLEDQLHGLTQPRAIMDAAVEQLGRHLGACRVGYSEVRPDGETVDCHSCFARGVEPILGTFELQKFGPESIARQTRGTTEIVPDIRADSTQVQSTWEALDTRAFVSVPLARDGQLIASLYVNYREPHAWTADEVALIEEVAARTWAAVEQAKAEEALSESEARYRQIVEGAEDFAIVSVDGRGVIKSWNTGAERITGFTEHEAIGRIGDFFFTPEDRAATEPDHELNRAESDGRSLNERWHQKKDGTLFWGSGLTMRMDRPGGGYLKIFRDRTAEHQAEAQLHELNETLEQRVTERTAERNRLWTMSRDLFAIMSFDGHLVAINPAWEETLGFDEATLLSRPFPEQVHPDDHVAVAAVIEELRRGETVARFEDRLRHADGSWRWIAWGLVPEGDVFYAVGRDITAEKLAAAELEATQSALRQAQKMEAVGQLTGGIAHDFNNLLGAVVGSFDLIRRKPDDPERVRRWAENGMSAAERGAKLTAQLLAFSRAQRLDQKAVPVAPLLEGMRDMLDRTLGPLVRLSLEIDGDGAVLSDSTQLEMAVLNLAINARDAMPDGGELSITTSPRQIDTDAELAQGEYVEIIVQDTGTGMPSDVVARAFDPFFTTKGVGRGTGLGLSQVYGLARQTGGTVRIESRVGEGTAVRILLPRTSVPNPLDNAGDAGAAPVAKFAATVLVIDDDAAIRGVLVDLLDSLGYRVIEAPDGPSGLVELERSTPDVVMVDFAMPGMNGAEVAKAVRSRRPGLPIVFSSGYSDTAAIEAAVGADLVLLRKPFRADELQAALSEVLASRS